MIASGPAKRNYTLRVWRQKDGRTPGKFAELLCLDALHRRESCGGHFREEFQTPDGEAQRDDQNFSYVAAWEFQGADKPPVLHKEPLVYEEVHMSTRSYK